MPANTAAPGDFVALAEEQLGWIGDLAQALVRHFEDADLVGRPEAVLHGAQDAVVMAAVALEIEHGVDHVLDDARAGDLAILGDVADEHDGGTRLLGKADHRLHAGAHLGDGAGRRIGKVAPQRLDRIDDDEVRALALGERGQNVLDIGFGRQQHVGIGGTPSRCARSRTCATASSPET